MWRIDGSGISKEDHKKDVGLRIGTFEIQWIRKCGFNGSVRPRNPCLPCPTPRPVWLTMAELEQTVGALALTLIGDQPLSVVVSLAGAPPPCPA